MKSVAGALKDIQCHIEEQCKGVIFEIEGDIVNCYKKEGHYIRFDIMEQTSSNVISIRAIIFWDVLKNTLVDNGCRIQASGTISTYNNFIQLDITAFQILQKNDSREWFSEWKKQQKSAAKQTVYKKPLPQLLENIAIITTAPSHGYSDFIHNLQYGKVTLFNIKMQGSDVPRNVSAMISRVNQLGEFDCICLFRAGGSDEALKIFDSSIISEAIQNSFIPVFTAIGHEKNHFRCDDVAERFFSTPTAIAYYISEQYKSYLEKNPLKEYQSPSIRVVKDIFFTHFPFKKVAAGLACLYFIHKVFIA